MLAKLLRLALMITSFNISLPDAVKAMELVMFDSPTCPYCKWFRREALPAYPSSIAGKTFPLRIIESNSSIQFHIKEPVTTTPTFMLVHRGKEVARFTGYNGRELFFKLVNKAAIEYQNTGTFTGQSHSESGSSPH